MASHCKWAAAALLTPASLALGAGGEEPNLFAGTLYQSAAALISFVLLVIILRKMAWGPILKGLQDREQKIKGDLEHADQANRKAQQVLADYEQKLQQAHADAQKLIEQARKDADAVRQRLTAETEQEIARLRQRATADITSAKNIALQELYDRCAELSVAAAGKILQKQIDGADARRLVDESLAELQQAGAR